MDTLLFLNNMRATIFILLAVLAYRGYCQNPIPLKDQLVENPSRRVSKYLNEKKWDELFPHRPGKGCNHSADYDFYSFKNFIAAATLFDNFLAERDTNIQKRELAAFLA